MKTKKLMSIVLALAMLCTVFGNLTAFALQSTGIRHSYYVTAKDKNGDVVSGAKIYFESTPDTLVEANGENALVFNTSGNSVDYTLCMSVPEGYKKVPSVHCTTSTELQSSLEAAGYTVSKENSEGLKFTLTITLEERTETTFKLTVNTVKDGQNTNSGFYNITYWNETTGENGCTEQELVPGINTTEIISYEDSDIKIAFTNAGQYDIPDEIVFKAKDIATASGDNWSVSVGDEENSYVLNVQMTGGQFLPPTAGGDADAKINTTVNFALGTGVIREDVPNFEVEICQNGEYYTKIDVVYYYLSGGSYAMQLPKYKDGSEAEYTLNVKNLDDNYKAVISGNIADGYTLTINYYSPFTVKAAVNSETTDVDTEKEGTQVNANDTVKVDVAVSGGDFTNADWEMFYDATLFEYVGAEPNSDVTAKGTVTTDTGLATISGKLIANAGLTTGDEFADGTAIVTYEFKALSQNADKVGTFKIISAHANNYVIAGTQDNKVANREDTTVEIVLVDDADKSEEDGTVTVPAGTFTAAEKVYNAQKQTGNAFVLDEDFAKAKVTYFANEDGSAVEDTAELATKSFKTTLPSWKNVGTYTYYAKIYGDGLKTTYVATTLTIKKATLTPSAMFTVDPDVKEVEFTPTLEGALDGTHTGTVTVKYTDINGEQTKTLNASDFAYDGETTSVYNGTIKATADTSGDFVVTLTYTDGEGDNYTGGTNTAKVNVDKITADKNTVEALEETITSVFGYDSTAHSVTVDEAAVGEVAKGDWTYTISDTTATVTNVGDDKMVKVTFTDTTGNYNDVIVYVILKVTPANVKITVNDNSKVMNEADPTPITTGTIQVVDEEGNEVTGTFNANGLYGTDDLEVSYEREAGEEVGTYNITASYYGICVCDMADI